jgi:hypothetical protein
MYRIYVPYQIYLDNVADLSNKQTQRQQYQKAGKHLAFILIRKMMNCVGENAVP